MCMFFTFFTVLTLFLFSLLSATFDRIAEINFNLDADDNSVSVLIFPSLKEGIMITCFAFINITTSSVNVATAV